MDSRCHCLTVMKFCSDLAPVRCRWHPVRHSLDQIFAEDWVFRAAASPFAALPKLSFRAAQGSRSLLDPWKRLNAGARSGEYALLCRAPLAGF
jgi:hypothetical protein